MRQEKRKTHKNQTKEKPNFYSIQLNHWLSNPEKRKTRETHQLGYLQQQQQQQQKVSVQEREREKKNLKRRRRKSGSVQEKKKKRGCQNEKFDVESSQMNEKSPLKFD